MERIGTLIISTIIAVVLATTLLLPIIGSALDTAGDPVTYTNSGANVGMRDNTAYYEITEDTSLSYTVDSSGITIGETNINYSTTATWGAVVWMDTGSFNVRQSTYLSRYEQYDTETNTSTVTSYTLPVTATLSGKTLTITDAADAEDTYTFNEGYCLDLRENEDGKKLFMAVDLTQRTGTFYLNSVSQVRCMGLYTTGENDCYYSLNNGTLTNDEGYANSIVATLSLVDGTTDVYLMESFRLDIGGEEFTPYYSIVPLEINGHAASGTVYTLVGMVPILVIAGLLVGIVYVVGSRAELF